VAEYKIVVREIASKENVYTETYNGRQDEVERRTGLIWKPPYSTNFGRYRLYVFEKGSRSAFMTIG